MENQEKSVMNFNMLKLAILTVGSARGEVINNTDDVAKFYIDFIGSLNKKQRVDYLEDILRRYKKNDEFTILGRHPEFYEFMAFDAIRINVARVKHYPISISKTGELLIYEDEVIKVQKMKKPVQKKKQVIEIDPNDVTILSEEDLKKQEEEKRQVKKDTEKPSPRKNRPQHTNEELKLFHKRHHVRPKGKGGPQNRNSKPVATNKPRPQLSPQRKTDVKTNGTKVATKKSDSSINKKVNAPIIDNVEIDVKNNSPEDVVIEFDV